MKITKNRLKKIIAEEISRFEEAEKPNPWAICTDSVGREDKEKYERCVKDVKAQHNLKEGSEGTTAFDLVKQISTALELIDAEAIKVDKEPPNLAAAARILYNVLETLGSDDPKLNPATPKYDTWTDVTNEEDLDENKGEDK